MNSYCHATLHYDHIVYLQGLEGGWDALENFCGQRLQLWSLCNVAVKQDVTINYRRLISEQLPHIVLSFVKSAKAPSSICANSGKSLMVLQQSGERAIIRKWIKAVFQAANFFVLQVLNECVFLKSHFPQLRKGCWGYGQAMQSLAEHLWNPNDVRPFALTFIQVSVLSIRRRGDEVEITAAHWQWNWNWICC